MAKYTYGSDGATNNLRNVTKKKTFMKKFCGLLLFNLGKTFTLSILSCLKQAVPHFQFKGA